MLERFVVDLSVFSPERVDYCTGARIAKDAPFVQERPAPRLHPGTIMDLDDWPDLTPEEDAQAHALAQAARAVVAPTREEQVRAVLRVQTPTMDADAMDSEVQRLLRQSDRGILAPDHPLVFANGVQTTAGALTAALDNRRLADPIEPDYGCSHAVLHWRGGDVRIVSWAHGVKRVFEVAQGYPGAPEPDADEPWPEASSEPEDSPCPVIRITTAMTAIVDQGQAALLALPDAPVIFQRARSLCLIARGVTPPRWLHRPQDAPVILEASPARLRELASHAARWEKHDARKDEWSTSLPPGWFVETLQGRPSWPFPVLEGIIGAPTLRPDGSVLDTPGYDVSTGLWFDNNGTHYPTLADHPTIDDARNAVNAVRDVLQDFPFVGSGSAAALSALLSVVCRFTIRGCVPLFAARSTTRGSGKGLLVDVLSIIGTGRPAPRWPQSDNDEEDRKRLLTVAMAGDATLHIDNVVKPLGSPALDLALTAPSVTDRLLGKTAKVEAPLTMVWFASGNNMQFKGDTARRVVPIIIDPQMEKPEERSGFAHDPLIPWVQHEHPRLTMAALTVVRAYCVAGRPAQGVTPYGSFEPWSDLIRQALMWAGEADCCAGRKDIEATSNPEYETLNTLLQTWCACYGNTAVTLKQMAQDLGMNAPPLQPGVPRTKWHDLHEALLECDTRSDGKRLDARRLGNRLRTWERRLVDGLRLVDRNKDRKGYTLWEIEGTPKSAESAESVSPSFSANPPHTYKITCVEGVVGTLETGGNRLGKTRQTRQDSADNHGRAHCPTPGCGGAVLPLADGWRCVRCNALVPEEKVQTRW